MFVILRTIMFVLSSCCFIVVDSFVFILPMFRGIGRVWVSVLTCVSSFEKLWLLLGRTVLRRGPRRSTRLLVLSTLIVCCVLLGFTLWPSRIVFRPFRTGMPGVCVCSLCFSLFVFCFLTVTCRDFMVSVSFSAL